MPDTSVLVIGGGPAGMEAALNIANAGFSVTLVEREPEAGGLLRNLNKSFPSWEDPADMIAGLMKRLEARPGVDFRPGTTAVAALRGPEGMSVTLRKDAEAAETVVTARAVVVATGFDLMHPRRYGEYGYGIYPGVVQWLEFESMLRQWTADPAGLPRAAAFIQCVGSRDRSKGVPYCSKICCMATAKQAGRLKDLSPDSQAWVFYMDYRAAGQGYEEFVRDVIETKHVRYVRGRPAKVLPDQRRLLVRAEDTLMGIPIEVTVDLVVLATAVVPRASTKELAAMLGARMDEHGFIVPLSSSAPACADGVFFAGGCGFAVSAREALCEGAAAAAHVTGYLKRKA